MLKIGDVIKENDPRTSGRRLTVIDFEGDYVWCKANTRPRTRILRKHIFIDDKPRRSGFSKVHRP